jgi:transposase-like protein
VQAPEAEMMDRDGGPGLEELAGDGDSDAIDSLAKLTGVDAHVLYKWMKDHQDNIPPKLKADGEKGRARMVLALFDSMATSEEKELLTDRTGVEGDKLKASLKLNHLVRGYFASIYQDQVIKCGLKLKDKLVNFPSGLAAGKILKVAILGSDHMK